MIVNRSRLRSATEEPPSEDEIPPPNRSDRPPPRPLCIKMKSASATLVITKTMEKIKIGVVIIGTGTPFTDVA
jgi:hypothetical protein